MTGPERHVLRAAAALILQVMQNDTGSSFSWQDGSVPASDVAELSKYPDLEDRRHLVTLDRKGYISLWTRGSYRGAPPHQRVRLTAKGWFDVLESR